MNFKDEWLRYSGLKGTPDEEAIRDWIARLCDIERPNQRQDRILDLAGRYLTSMDLPGEVFNRTSDELIDAVRADMAASKHTP